MYWFTLNGELTTRYKVRKHLFDTFVDVPIQNMIWNIITNSAKAGESFEDLIQKYANDEDITLVDYLQELLDDGFQCHGGIEITPTGYRELYALANDGPLVFS